MLILVYDLSILFLSLTLKMLAVNIGDILDFKDFRLVENFMRNANSGRQERLGPTSQLSQNGGKFKSRMVDEIHRNSPLS